MLLSGCGEPNTAAALWQDYQKRLERVFEKKAPTQKTTPVLAQKTPTRALSLRQDDGSDNISILQLNAIRGCRLGELIADHNSILGKVAEPSVWLNYQLSFIQTAPSCLTALEDGELKNKLARTLEHKKTQASAYFIEFLNTEPVLERALFIRNESLDGSTPLAGLTELSLAVEAILYARRAIERGEFDLVSISSLDEALRTLNRNPMLGRYMRGMNTHLSSLETINAFLSKQEVMRCKPGHNPARQDILLNILMKYFIGKIQPYLGAYSEIQFAIGASAVNLFEGTRFHPQIHYYFLDEQATTVLKKGIRDHVVLWQGLQQSCALEIKPGTAGRKGS